MNDRVTIHDCRVAGYCIANGVKPKCEQLGLDFKKLVREGLPMSDLEEIEDAQVRRILAIAKNRIIVNG